MPVNGTTVPKKKYTRMNVSIWFAWLCWVFLPATLVLIMSIAPHTVETGSAMSTDDAYPYLYATTVAILVVSAVVSMFS